VKSPRTWPNAKLSRAQVEEIRGLLRHEETYRAIGKRFGVAKSTIAKIANGQSWVSPQ
jgi:IS30 family transposase